ncbi:Acid protease [Mycena indigotica]|uniref:Acid protease n=1 Tax=Mycena indigotica TaxID=2126181 RepID=A0A8H6SGX2_9AGAR|nr:Acid protease [Mycena indigotica]KAF7299164.1 Acid protease [Mycena indigotica]
MPFTSLALLPLIFTAFTDAAYTPSSFSAPISGRASRRRDKANALGSNGITSLAGANTDSEYLVNVTVGGQNFRLLVDTGSADLYIPNINFTCVNATGNTVPQSTCALGSAGFDPTASKTFQLLDNVSFNNTYGTGEFVAGPMGLDTVTIAGIEVKKQVVAVPDIAFLEGNGERSGILGLAFPDDTHLFNVSDPTKASSSTRNPYDSFFLSAYKQNKVNRPYFSLALNRGSVANELNSTLDPNLGYIAFGGDVPVAMLPHTSTTVPIQTVALSSNTSAEFLWYAVTIDSYNFPGSESIPAAANGSSTPGPTIIDSGTQLVVVPEPVAAGYASKFNPPATLTAAATGLSLWTADCNATVPEFSVTIGRKNFTMDQKDLLFPVLADKQGDIVCLLGVQNASHPALAFEQSIFILGDTFLHNVVTTFNPIDKEVALTERAPY